MCTTCYYVLSYYHILTVHTDTVNIHHKLILNACCTHINHITCTQKIKSITFATLNDYMKCAKGYSDFHYSIVTLQDSEWLFKPCLHQTLDQELHEWCQAMFLATGKKQCLMRRWLCKEEPHLRTHHVHLWALEGFLNSFMNQKAVHVCLQIRFGRVFFLPLRFLFKDSDNKRQIYSNCSTSKSSSCCLVRWQDLVFHDPSNLCSRGTKEHWKLQHSRNATSSSSAASPRPAREFCNLPKILMGFAPQV